LVAVGTGATGTDTGNNYPIADLEVLHCTANFSDGADTFVAQNAALGDGGDIAFENMEIGATNSGGVDLDDDIGRLLDDGVGNFFPLFQTGTVLDECFHGLSSLSALHR